MTGSSPKQNMLYLIRTPPRHSPKVQGRFSLSIHVLKAYFRILSPYPYISTLAPFQAEFAPLQALL